MNILRGSLSKRKMAKFAGVKCQDVDRSLANLASLGYIEYKKIKGGKYTFILYSQPVRIRELNDEPR
jgi:DNA-binding transcriptional regulator YhcF (GntR family)